MFGASAVRRAVSALASTDRAAARRGFAVLRALGADASGARPSWTAVTRPSTRSLASPMPRFGRFMSGATSAAADNAEAAAGAVDKTEESPHVKDGAKTERLAFQAETRQLLDIVTHSLYTDREVFLRELVSNAADALEKARHVMTTGKQLLASDKSDFRVSITLDEKNHTLTLEDNGIGMTKEELVSNLGTIARSGSRAFLKELRDRGEAGDTNLIGMFGVGFYAAFMVADSVTVYSKSAAHPDSPAHCWTSDGSGEYEVMEAEGVHRGTRIVLRLKEDARQFSDSSTVESVIMKYSNFVNFPIYLNNRKMNTIQALWTMEQDKITDDQFSEFYRYIASAFDKPRYRVHFASDAPIHLRALFFVGESHYEKTGMGRMPPGVSIYSRRVLIKSKAEDVLPGWMRFFKGVVDSDDLPLSISRENMQDSALIRKMNNVLTRRLLRFLEDQAKRDPVEFKKFWSEYGMFLKEGVVSDHGNTFKAQLAKLLRFESSSLPVGEVTSLDEYLSRCAMEQKDVYFLTAPARHLAEASPYMEAFKQRGMEVLYCYEPIDDFVMQALMNHEGKKLVSAQVADLDLPDMIKAQAGQKDGKDGEAGDEKESGQQQRAGAGKLDGSRLDAFKEWLGGVLKEEVLAVKATTRLSTTPAIVTGHESEAMRQMMKMAGLQNAQRERVDLEINPAHPVIVRADELRNADPDAATEVARQLFDNARVAAGILDDPRNMLPRLYKLLDMATEAAVDRAKAKQAVGSSSPIVAAEEAGASSAAPSAGAATADADAGAPASQNQSSAAKASGESAV